MTARDPFWVSTANGAAFDFAGPSPTTIILDDVAQLRPFGSAG